VLAYDGGGRLLDKEGLIRLLAQAGGAPETGGLYLCGIDGEPAEGRPWWSGASTAPAWAWSGPERVRFSLPWPAGEPGRSTLILDGDATGYMDGQTVLVNEEAARWAWRNLRESLDRRTTLSERRYAPGRRFRKLEAKAMAEMMAAQAAGNPRKRAALFDQALESAARGYDAMLLEHGGQIARDPKAAGELRFGLSLDETAADRMLEHEWIADRLGASGADWARIVFRAGPDDFFFERESSFILYDSLIQKLRLRGLRVMGAILDGPLRPPGLTPLACVRRTRNLVRRYRASISSWETASEPNAASGGPIEDESVLEASMACAAEVKRIDPKLETVAALRWWEGSAPGGRQALFAWLRWGLPRGFGRNLDVAALVIRPDECPMGTAFDPVFAKLGALLPDKRLMLGGFTASGRGAGAEEAVLYYTAAACSIPGGLGGGFYLWTLRDMLAPDRFETPLARSYRRTLRRLRP
jgi:hypothetical protein